MILDQLKAYRIILASQSPRRQQLLSELGIQFEIRTKTVEEIYPPDLKREDVALFLCKHKAVAFEKDLKENELLITADTIVCLDQNILNKPADRGEAINMLKKLSGRRHEVISGVCLTTSKHQRAFFSETAVYFKTLSNDEITWYIDHFQPYDKAGAYGIQEWIGFIGINKIEGCYYNVMGLPLSMLYDELKRF